MKAPQLLTTEAYYILMQQLSRRCYGHKSLVKGELRTTNKSRSQNIVNYLKERDLTDTEIAAIPPLYFKRNSRLCNTLLFADRKLAKPIALTICAKMRGEYVLEFDAGIGIMSEILLPLCKNLRLYAPNSHLAAYLQEKFRNELKNELRIFNKSISNMLGILYGKLQDFEAFHKLVEGLPCKPWTEDISTSMITPIANINYMKSLVSNLVEENSFKQFGRPEFFFLFPSSIAEPLLFKERCHMPKIPIHFLFHSLFDVEILISDLPRNSFLPWPSLKKLQKRPENNVFLVHAVPKLDKFGSYLDNQFLNLFLTFVRSALRQRRRIIPTFESFVPNCGSRFIIEDGLDIYTEFHEITPEKFFNIFKKLTTYCEFDTKLLERDEFDTIGEEDPDQDDSDSENIENPQD